MKKLLLSILLLIPLSVKAADIDMNVKVIPDIQFTPEIGLSKTMDITHQGNNCKYSMSFKVNSNLGSHWGIDISAPPMVSADGKTTLAPFLLNYKLYGGESVATPAQGSNIWLPVPAYPTPIYLSSDSEMVKDEVSFNIVVFVTPQTALMQKTFKTKLTVTLVPL